jgi:hypothetical protein
MSQLMLDWCEKGDDCQTRNVTHKTPRIVLKKTNDTTNKSTGKQMDMDSTQTIRVHFIGSVILVFYE